MTHLSKLKFSDKQRSQVKMTVDERLRHKLIDRLKEQKELAEADLSGNALVKTRYKSIKDEETGSGKLSLGPGLLAFRNFTKVFNDGDSLLAGGFGYQQWSVAGEGSRQDVSKFFVAPVLVYHFDSLFGQKQWYAGLPDDLWSYDFKKSEFTSIPLGARIGKVFSIGKQPVNAFLQSWYNAADSGADYTIKFNFTFLFPE